MSKFNGTVLALDLSTVTGWAFGKPGEKPRFGHIRFVKAGATRPRVYRAFRDWMEETWNVRDHQPDLIVYESPAVPMIMSGRTNIDTVRFLTGLAEHLEEWAYEVCDLREAAVKDVRVHFIGQNLKSKIAKPLVVQRCQQLGWPVETDDEGDACALWDYQISWLRPDIAVRHTPLFQNLPRRSPPVAGRRKPTPQPLVKTLF